MSCQVFLKNHYRLSLPNCSDSSSGFREKGIFLVEEERSGLVVYAAIIPDKYSYLKAIVGKIKLSTIGWFVSMTYQY